MRRILVLEGHLRPNETKGPFTAVTGESNRLRVVVQPTKPTRKKQHGSDDESPIDAALERMEQMSAYALQCGGEDAVITQHKRGRYTIRERIDKLLDEGSFQEVGRLAGTGEVDDDGTLTSFLPGNYVMGTGRIAGKPCVVGGEDYTIGGGSPNLAGLRKGPFLSDCIKISLTRIRLGLVLSSDLN